MRQPKPKPMEVKGTVKKEEEPQEKKKEKKELVQHLYGQLEEWEKTMSALPVIAERLRSLGAVERRGRAAEGSVDKMLREQYCAQATLREVKEALFEVERCICVNKEAVEANIRYIESLVSPQKEEGQQHEQQQQNEEGQQVQQQEISVEQEETTVIPNEEEQEEHKENPEAEEESNAQQ